MTDSEDSALIRGVILSLSPADGLTPHEMAPLLRRMDVDRIRALCAQMSRAGLVVRVDRKCRATRKLVPAYIVR